MEMTGKKRSVIAVVVGLLILWFVVGTIDFFRVSSFERPMFCMGKESVYKGAEDYKNYQGIGYSFVVAENSSESEFPGVTRYTYFLFGNEVVSGMRD